MSLPEAPRPVEDYQITNVADMEKKQFPEDQIDDPFGNEDAGEVKYRIMPWW